MNLLNTFEYDGLNGPSVPVNIVHPTEFYSLLISDDLLQRLADETNRYAEQQIVMEITNETLSLNSKLGD